MKAMLFVALTLLNCAPASNPVDQFLLSIDFSGAALVVADGNVIVRAGYGAADRELNVPNTAEGVFRIGSLTKPLTSTAVLHAVESGILRLDDPVCEFIRVCPEEWRAVAIRQLLNHTSGIPDLFGVLASAPVLETTAEVDRVLRERVSVPLRTNPGIEFAYSNFNYVLAAYVLEVASGEDWESYLRKYILSPVGAVHTRYDDAWTLVDGRVHGYTQADGRVRPIAYKDHSGYAAGGLLSTVDDLRRWHEAFVEAAIINNASVELAVTPYRGDYGFGWQVIEALGRPLQNHSGGISGFTSHLAWYPDERLLVVLLSNVEGTDVKAIACDIARIVFADPDQPSATRVWLERSSADRCRQGSTL
ncbi:MAG: beta-lactamase family protein [Gemmatimonadetes bacterium]|nr:beta-lactamase family protein [Gemmatimonadota bacterium]